MAFLLPFLPAIIGGVATVGAGVLAANSASKATDKALTAQNTSTQESLAAQKAALDRITGLQQPFINAGVGQLPGLANRVGTGAPNFSAPSYALPQSSAYPAPPPAPNANAGLMDRATGVPEGSLGTGKTGNGTFVDPASAGPPSSAVPAPSAGAPPQATGPDWDAYIAANPDVAAWIQAGHGDPNLGPSQTPEQAAAYHYYGAGPNDPNSGQTQGRAGPPMLAPSAGATTAPVQPSGPLNLGTASPVVANYTRPDQGSSPSASQFIDPSKFTTSPGFQFRLDQGLRNTNASFGAKGLLQSGAALQGFNDYAANSASQEYQNWFTQQQQLYSDAANQFVSDRNNSNQNFADDRSYGTNLAISNRDFANNQYNTQTQNMFQLAGIGANEANALTGAVTGNANNQANLFTNQGNNAANAANAQGSTNAQLAGTIGSTVANLFNGPSRFPQSTLIPGSGTAPNGGNATFVNPLPTQTFGGPF